MIRCGTAAEAALAPAFLDGLQRCFTDWGGDDRFDWCFRRDAGAGTAALMIAEEDGAAVAGAALHWRQLTLGGERIGMVGVLGSAWTLPAWRGRGLFETLSRLALAMAAERGALAMLAFVTDGRRSAAAMAAMADIAVPTGFLTAADNGTPGGGVSADDAGEDFPARRGDALRFGYGEGAWRAQMTPPGAEPMWRRVGVARALLADVAGQRRLIDLQAPDDAGWHAAVTALAGEAAGAGQRLSLFTADAARRDALIARGWAVQPATLYLMGCRDARVRAAHWDLAVGDRM